MQPGSSLGRPGPASVTGRLLHSLVLCGTAPFRPGDANVAASSPRRYRDCTMAPSRTLLAIVLVVACHSTQRSRRGAPTVVFFSHIGTLFSIPWDIGPGPLDPEMREFITRTCTCACWEETTREVHSRADCLQLEEKLNVDVLSGWDDDCKGDQSCLQTVRARPRASMQCNGDVNTWLSVACSCGSHEPDARCSAGSTDGGSGPL